MSAIGDRLRLVFGSAWHTNSDAIVEQLATEIGAPPDVVAGTVSASKEVVVDASKNLTGLNNLTMTGLLAESNLIGITAGTTRTQAGATALTKEVNRVDTSTAPAAGNTVGDGVLLPASVAGVTIININNTSNPVQVYGTGADTINGATNTVGVAQPPNSVCLFVSGAAGTWQAEGIGIGFSGSLQTMSAATSVTAHSGGTQAGAQGDAVAQLNAMLNNITVVAVATDSVALPAAKVGLSIIVRNSGANSMQVFGAGTDTVNSIATGTGVPQDPGTTVTYNCHVAGNWISVPDASKPAKWTTGALQSATFAAGALSGAGFVAYTNTGATPGSLATRTATQMFNDAHNAQVGQTYILMIANSSGNTMTITAGVGVTLTGTMTLATNTTRIFAVTFNSATTLTIQNFGAGTFS
jgi:hypothetical protein